MAITNQGTLEGTGAGTPSRRTTHEYRPPSCNHPISWVYYEGASDDPIRGWDFKHGEDASILRVQIGEPETEWRQAMRQWILYLHKPEPKAPRKRGKRMADRPCVYLNQPDLHGPCQCDVRPCSCPCLPCKARQKERKAKAKAK